MAFSAGTPDLWRFMRGCFCYLIVEDSGGYIQRERAERNVLIDGLRGERA